MTLVTFGAGIMLKRPIAAAYLAGISNAWATLEAALVDLIEFLISMRQPSNIYAIDPLGTELFRSLQTFNLRWDALLKSALRTRLTAQDYASIEKRLKKLRKKIRAAGDLRNELVHSIYGADDSDDDNLIKSKPYSVMKDSLRPNELVNHLYLEAVIMIIQDARVDLSMFSMDVKHMAQANRP